MRQGKARHIERSKNVKAAKRIERESSGCPGLDLRDVQGTFEWILTYLSHSSIGALGMSHD